jgi:hypothetical protein
VYRVIDVTLLPVANTVCNYMRHYLMSADGDTTDYLFVACNAIRFDLADANTMYKEAPMLMKLKHDTG